MPRIQRSATLAAAAVIATLAGCAPLSGPSSSSLAQGGQPRGRCSVAPRPAELPPPDALVEAAFRAEAERAWVRAGRPAGHVLFSVRHAPDGVQVRRAVIESTVPAALADSLQALVYAYRRQAPAAPEEWGVRLRVDFADDVALRVGRREECAPRPREDERIAADPFDVRERDMSSASALPSTDAALVWVRVRLDANGRVTDASVERGVRRGVWEQRLLTQVRAMAFYPALEDGYPVPGETTISMRLGSTL